MGVETGAGIITEMVEVLGQIGISMVEIVHGLTKDTYPSSILCNENYDLRVFIYFIGGVLELEIKR